MGFGFVNDEEGEEKQESKELPHNLFNTLKHKNWDELEEGQTVQSVLTGASGVINFIDRKWLLINISWENGKQSRASKNELNKVILL